MLALLVARHGYRVNCDLEKPIDLSGLLYVWKHTLAFGARNDNKMKMRSNSQSDHN